MLNEHSSLVAICYAFECVHGHHPQLLGFDAMALIVDVKALKYAQNNFQFLLTCFCEALYNPALYKPAGQETKIILYVEDLRSENTL